MKNKKRIILSSIFIVIAFMILNVATYGQGPLPPNPPESAPLDNNTLYLLLGGLGFAGNYVYGILRKNRKQ